MYLTSALAIAVAAFSGVIHADTRLVHGTSSAASLFLQPGTEGTRLHFGPQSSAVAYDLENPTSLSLGNLHVVAGTSSNANYKPLLLSSSSQSAFTIIDGGTQGIVLSVNVNNSWRDFTACPIGNGIYEVYAHLRSSTEAAAPGTGCINTDFFMDA